MTLKLRRATPADADALTEIMMKAKASWGYSNVQMAKIRELYHVRPDGLAPGRGLIASLDGTPVAYSIVEAQEDGALLLDHLFVLPEAQGRGIGKLLLRRAEDAARARGLKRLVLESDAHAERFYQRHGFETKDARASQSIAGQLTPLMEKRLPSAVHSVTAIDFTVSSAPWGFALANRAEIDAHFAELQKRNPHLWNGATLKLVGYTFENGLFKGSCAHCDYASFLAWRDWGAPDLTAFNLFGSSIIISSDQALLYGVMAPTTAAAGLIYPPGGHLDPADIAADGKVDIEASLRRELAEETGICASETVIGNRIVTFDGPRIAISRVFHVDQPADALRERILAHSMQTEEKELSDIRIVREPADLHDPAIVPYAREVGERFFENGL